MRDAVSTAAFRQAGLARTTRAQIEMVRTAFALPAVYHTGQRSVTIGAGLTIAPVRRTFGGRIPVEVAPVLPFWVPSCDVPVPISVTARARRPGKSGNTRTNWILKPAGILSDDQVEALSSS